MDLRSKLGLYKEGREEEKAVKAETAMDVHNLTDGIVCTNDDGSFFMLEKRYPLSYRYGGFGLGEALTAAAPSLEKLAGPDAGPDISAAGLLFLDTETTGLSGGTGTVAFLIGIGFFEEESFVVRQYFMRDYDEEPAILRALNERLGRFKGLVTFNGKSFDWNLLLGRFTFNRIKPAKREPLHIDLLFPARRIWGLKLESCRLCSLEENILSEFRSDDIPGALIPSVYFKYLEDRDASDIIKVIKHNELDILAMVAILRKITAMLETPFSDEHGDFELLGLGRIFEACGELDQVIDCFESCSRSESFTVRNTAVRKLTGIYKKNGDFAKALPHWQDAAGAQGGLSLFSMVEMAKYYEHKEKDAVRALLIVEKAMEICRQAGLRESSQFSELGKRRDRLKRKAEKLS
jgi:hypothetical protein